MTGYTGDKIRPPAEPEPPAAKAFPHCAPNPGRSKPPTQPMLLAVTMPRPSHEPAGGATGVAIRERYGMNAFGQSCLLARRLIEAGTRVVQVNWPKVATSDNHSWDVHVDLSKRMKTQSAPMLDAGLSGLITDLDERGLLKTTLVVAVGEFGRSPQRGVSTSGN